MAKRITLTPEMIEHLIKLGNRAEDVPQIRYAMRSDKTKYRLCTEKFAINITKAEAIEKLGIEQYLAGISRSAFHRSAVQEIYADGKPTGNTVHFDSSRIFR
ncbi:MAG: hypothetical protein IJK26_09925 [Clostridia bacterium]|nr:hypothetical protein [Clostridia bacterium]